MHKGTGWERAECVKEIEGVEQDKQTVGEGGWITQGLE